MHLHCLSQFPTSLSGSGWGAGKPGSPSSGPERCWPLGAPTCWGHQYRKGLTFLHGTVPPFLKQLSLCPQEWNELRHGLARLQARSGFLLPPCSVQKKIDGINSSSVVERLKRPVQKPSCILGDNCKKAAFVTVVSGEMSVFDRQRDILIVQRQPLVCGRLAPSCHDNRITGPRCRQRRPPALIGRICHCRLVSIHKCFSSSGGHEHRELA